MPQLGGLTKGSRRLNRAILVYVAKFDPGVDLTNRPGAKRDAKRLHRVLKKLGFEVKLYEDPSSEEICQLYRRESQQPVRDVFLTVLSSHGNGDCVFGADGNAVQLSRIFTFFHNENMEEKTKLFLVQACRGHGLDDGVEVESSDGDTDDSNASDDSDASGSDASDDGDDGGDASVLHDLSLPVDAAVMFAASPGYGAFTNPLGSVFLQTFCDLLDDRDYQNLDLTRLMTRLASHVAHRFRAKGRHFNGSKMMPCFQMRLTREVFPFAKPGKEGGASGIAATSLVEEDVIRRRNHSIS